MCIGTGTAIGLAVAGGASIASSAIQAHAAGKASEQQQLGAQRASATMQGGLDRLGQLYSPYVNQGASAQNTLSRLTTPGRGAKYASQGAPDRMAQIAPKKPVSFGNDAYDEIGGYFKDLTGRDPTLAQVSGWGTKLDDNYRSNIRAAIGATPEAAAWRAQNAQPVRMATGGDMMVNRPTLFLAGEAGPERATFTPQGPPQGGPSNPLSQKLIQKYSARMAPPAPGPGPIGAAMGGAPLGPPPQGPPPGQGGPPMMGPPQGMGGPPPGMRPQGPPQGMPPQMMPPGAGRPY